MRGWWWIVALGLIGCGGSRGADYPTEEDAREALRQAQAEEKARERARREHEAMAREQLPEDPSDEPGLSIAADPDDAAMVVDGAAYARQYGRPKARKLLLTEIAMIERLFRKVGRNDRDRPPLMARLATGYAELMRRAQIDAAESDGRAREKSQKVAKAARKKAFQYLVRVAKQYPESKHVPAMFLLAGVIFLDEGQPTRARRYFQQAASYPGTHAGERAKEELALLP